MRHSKPVRLGNRTYRGGESVYLFLDFAIISNSAPIRSGFKATFRGEPPTGAISTLRIDNAVTKFLAVEAPSFRAG